MPASLPQAGGVPPWAAAVAAGHEDKEFTATVTDREAAGADAVHSLYRFLLQSEELRSRPVRTLDSAERVLWLDELPRNTRAVDCGIVDPDDGDAWLEADRVRHTRPPDLPVPLEPWVDPRGVRDWERTEPPPLRETPLPGHGSGAEWAGQEEHPAPEDSGEGESDGPDEAPDETVRETYARWSRRWLEWAEDERSKAPFVKAYEALFRIHQEAHDYGDAYELVLGVGHLTWTADGHPVRRHLVARRLVSSMDESGRIELVPDPEASRFELEEEMLEADQRLREEPRGRVLGALEEAEEVPAAEAVGHLHRALEEWAVATSAEAEYSRSMAAPAPAGGAAKGAEGAGEGPVVAFAPAVILRQRPQRGRVDALKRIVEALGRGEAATDLVQRLVGTDLGAAQEDAQEEDTGEPTAERGAPDEGLYFSLPSNAEQRRIASRLQDSDLVVVQGPPGTGKTHTIANLVTDLLAKGQRVLITSETTRALKVLKDKLPEEIRPLAVSRTGDGLEAKKELETSVQAILERRGDHDARQARRDIAGLEDRLEKARTDRDQALKDLRGIREQETYEHPRTIGDYSGRLSAIARRLADEEERYSWVGQVPADHPTVTADTLRALVDAARAVGPEARRLAAEVPEASGIPSPGEFAESVQAIAAADEAYAQASGIGGADLGDLLAGVDPERCERIRTAMDAFIAARDTARRLGERWAPSLADVLAGRSSEVAVREEGVRKAVGLADQETRRVGDALVTGLDAFGVAEALGSVSRLSEGLASGGRLRGLLGRTRLAKDHASFLASVQVDGRPLESADDAATVLARVTAERALQEAEGLLVGDTAAGRAWQQPPARIARLQDAKRDLDVLIALADARRALTEACAGLPGLASLDLADADQVNEVGVLLAAVDAENSAADHRERVERAVSLLRDWSGRASEVPEGLTRAREALESGDPDAYAAACADMARVREAARLVADYEAAYGALAAGHAALAGSVAADPHLPEWERRIDDFDRAWAWSAWNSRLAELTDPRAEEKARARLAEADGEVRLTMARLAAARAWTGCLDRLDDAQEIALSSYQTSVNKIGKGTGKYVGRLQRQAQESLRECTSAVPAWIMPFYQVVSTIPMERPGVFDVVVVDEASQSGPTALVLAWLAEKVVVVGDDKQVSPADVGVDQGSVFTMQQRHLGALTPARRNLFSPNRSLFDIVSGLAGGRGRLMLKEHFRCMPEIIGFSNEHFYQGRLQALRQFGGDRLTPLRSVHVPEGRLEGKGQRQTNPYEARRLVRQVAECCADPAYAGRTMGIIVLQSGRQQALIEDLLAAELDLEERVSRRIRVGTPSAFQGDERDVVFIGAVYAPFDSEGEPRRAAPYSSEGAQQAINVAASRARDQVWLFHSFALTDLGETDLRRAYLDYLDRPVEQQDGTGLAHVPEDERVDPFDSLFEQRVFRALRARGYRVLPQYQAGPFRIDLVVEGHSRRLAVECDGDAFHNEANAAEDAARQRELERVGWTFERIRGSRFFRDPDGALIPLWERLDGMGIEPVRT